MDKLYKIDDYELLNQKVYRILKTRIIKGTIEPGSKLLEKNISEKLGVSRTPVREAIQRLAAEGYVKKIPNRRVAVAEVSYVDYQEVLKVCEVLEGLAGYSFTKKSTPEKIEKLQKNLYQMSQICDGKNADTTDFYRLNKKFHGLILDGSGNSYLQKILGDLYNQYQMFQDRALNIPSRFGSVLEEHKKIVEAFKKGDAKLAEKLSREHVCNGMKIFSKSKI